MNDLILGIMIGTAHVGAPAGTSGETHGIYARVGDISGGYFRNSWQYPSFWAGRSYRCGPVECLVGGVTGYADAPVLPMLAVSRKWGDVRLTASAGGMRTVALTMSIEGKN